MAACRRRRYHGCGSASDTVWALCSVVSRDEFLHMVEKSPVLLNIMTNCLLPGTDGMRGPFEDWSARHTKFGMALVVKVRMGGR